MKQIRRGVFETNSSSTHAFALYKSSALSMDLSEMTGDISPYMEGDNAQIDYPIHTFESIEDKLRYFYTLYCRYANPKNDSYSQRECRAFMEKLFKIFPKVKFSEPPEDCWSVLYMEDADYVFDDFMCGNDELWMKLQHEDDIKNFMLNGVIYFGDRDAGNPYSYFSPWDDVWDYNGDIIKITKVSG